MFAALTGIGAGAQTVHRDGESLVSLGGDGAVAHRTRRETLDDLAGRLDLVNGDRRPLADVELEESTQCCKALRLVVDQGRVFLEHLVLPCASGMLELEYRVRVEQVVLAFTTPLVLAAYLE